MKELISLRSFEATYKGVICDLWGVVHDGQYAFPDAIQALEKLKADGVIVILLSNSPRPSELVTRQIYKMGVTGKAYDELITSGDLARYFLKNESANKSFFHIGPSRDRGTLDGLPNPEVKRFIEAEYILCTGFFENQPLEPELYKKDFLEGIRKNIPFICANPDREVDICGKRTRCAGFLAEFYEQLGGKVIWLGKPKKIAYQAAFDAIERKTGRKVNSSELLAIGDNLETDIAGASKMGIKTILISGGLHGHWQVGDTEFEALMKRLQVRPDAIMKQLVWK